MRAGVIGLGSMGMGVARSLLRAGFSVSGYDLRIAPLELLASLGGHAAASPAEVGSRSDAVVLLVLNAAETEEAIFGANGLAATMQPGSVVITSSTVPPAAAVEFGRRLREAGLLHIDAPVSGGPVRSAEGQLSIMASGPPEAFRNRIGAGSPKMSWLLMLTSRQRVTERSERYGGMSPNQHASNCVAATVLSAG